MCLFVQGAVTLTSRIGKFTNAIILDGNLHNGAQLQKDEADIVLRSIEALDDQEEGGGCSLLHLMHGLWTRRIAFMKPSMCVKAVLQPKICNCNKHRPNLPIR